MLKQDHTQKEREGHEASNDHRCQSPEWSHDALGKRQVHYTSADFRSICTGAARVPKDRFS